MREMLTIFSFDWCWWWWYWDVDVTQLMSIVFVYSSNFIYFLSSSILFRFYRQKLIYSDRRPCLHVLSSVNRPNKSEEELKTMRNFKIQNSIFMMENLSWQEIDGHKVACLQVITITFARNRRYGAKWRGRCVQYVP